MRLSEAIDQGLANPDFREHIEMYLSPDHQRAEPGGVCGCVLGAALTGAGFAIADYENAQERSGWPSVSAIASLLGIPSTLVRQISAMHHSAVIPASVIAGWVREEHPDLCVKEKGA